MIFLIELIRNGVEISIVGHGAVEGVVKHTHLGSVRHELVNGTDAFQVAGVVNGCEIAKALDTFLHALVYNNALLIEVAALHDAVTHSVDLLKALDSANLRVEQTLEHEVHAFLMVRHVVHNLFLLAVRQCHLDECLIEADTFNTSCCKHRVVVHIIKFVFD